MPASFLPIRAFSFVVALSAGAAGVAACADSLHLDPGGGGKDGGVTTTSTGTQGGGGQSGGACMSNSGCDYPTPVCDTIAQKCVECLTFTDCDGPKPGTVCSGGKCVCPAPEGSPMLSYCADPAGKQGRCVDQQTSPSDCGGCGKACFGSCTAGKCADKWRPISSVGAPSPRTDHVAVWTGTKMFVWGGKDANGPTNTGGLYDPATDTWTPTSTANAPAGRSRTTAVWDDADKLVLVWGGAGVNGPLGSGAMYDPEHNTWTAIPAGGAPSPRTGHTAVWATFTVPFGGAMHGMIVWGGADSTVHLGDGAVFDPTSKKWVGNVDGSASASIPPSPRAGHTAVWDPGLHQMIVWGGYGISGTMDNQYLGDGAVWDPSLTGTAMAWTPVSTGGPSPRAGHTAVFAVDIPSFMIVWGGFDGTNYLSDGDQYKSLSWLGLGTPPSPEGREGHTAVWIDAVKQMIVFGGDQGVGAVLDTAWSLDASLLWTPLPTGPAARTHHTAVVNGSTMIVWGGTGVGDHLLGDGAIYDAAP